jgi:hypothetical protein
VGTAYTGPSTTVREPVQGCRGTHLLPHDLDVVAVNGGHHQGHVESHAVVSCVGEHRDAGLRESRLDLACNGGILDRASGRRVGGCMG